MLVLHVLGTFHVVWCCVWAGTNRYDKQRIEIRRLSFGCHVTVGDVAPGFCVTDGAGPSFPSDGGAGHLFMVVAGGVVGMFADGGGWRLVGVMCLEVRSHDWKKTVTRLDQDRKRPDLRLWSFIFEM
ncbi:uncharacterized protein LACBIDRAFT_332526 [Laccaria bicolor S238N-H82]|uniref:Predicted protein n=1 Tax=Laccaria bicolor (strain S238N-H82 / ATCC MYA-4686) TaxID=486041 RepID=B0DT11_LACBS|nr:uncharacterized protein LACBIDRAFT_332526 [Laccaria bicolor S238N-H82]EDR02413.1 predicted protein [Laccaria bicolor S238N-H82]|eukprot:XP_001887090.1 predicted protein [Laccaria bicolor S238N-H82]